MRGTLESTTGSARGFLFYMDQKSSFGKNFNQGPFKKVDNKLPEKFQARNVMPKQNPYFVRDLAREILMGPEVKTGHKTKVNLSEKTHGIFGKQGITRSKLKQELEKIPDHFTIKMDRQKRGSVASTMDRKYGDIIDIKDVDLHIKSLRKLESLGKTEKERLAAKHERVLLEKAKIKKPNGKHWLL